jgi:hypothetical protein
MGTIDRLSIYRKLDARPRCRPKKVLILARITLSGFKFEGAAFEALFALTYTTNFWLGIFTTIDGPV